MNAARTIHPPGLLLVLPDAGEVGSWVARRIGGLLAAAAENDSRVVIGCPAGRTPRTSYAALSRLAQDEALDLSRLELVLMDDYVVASGDRYQHCPIEAAYSCRRFAEDEIRAVLNARLPPERSLPRAQVHCPDPNEPERYEDQIAALGGIDLFLLASGASDGHVAFNPPGSERTSRTRILTLAQSTRQDNLGTFPSLRSLDDVPRFGVSVGLGTIVEHSRAAVLLLLGVAKHVSLVRTLRANAFDPAWPASIIFACRDARIVTDTAAFRGDAAPA